MKSEEKSINPDVSKDTVGPAINQNFNTEFP